jgi:hypothetical protein
MQPLELWLAKMENCIWVKQIDSASSSPAFVQNWSHVPLAEASADLAYPLLPLSLRSALGELGASTTVCGLDAKDDRNRDLPLLIDCSVHVATVLVWMEAGVDSRPT